MFTIEEINSALNKVKTGADFPAFVSALKKMGVKRNDVYVMNGMAIYFGDDDETVESGPVYESLLIEERSDAVLLREALAAHQQGQTDFQTFCRQAAEAGVEKWIIDTESATVSYLDASGNEVLAEKIPL